MFPQTSNSLKAEFITPEMLTAYARDNKPGSVSTQVS